MRIISTLTWPWLFAAFAAAGLAAVAVHSADRPASGELPSPAIDASLATVSGQQAAVLAGGCFWGVQAVFEHVAGVVSATSGYAGGSAESATYGRVSGGDTGHAESVRIVYDPAKISYGQLLKIYFSVAHDPTQLNRQGPDSGSQYRSAIFYGSPEQQRIAQAYVAQLQHAGAFTRPIVTQIVPLNGFYPAEAYHQDYARRHPSDLYIMLNDAPKVEALKARFPVLYRPG
jgi:peptide-methionine (S)-S-oxide reductase